MENGYKKDSALMVIKLSSQRYNLKLVISKSSFKAFGNHSTRTNETECFHNLSDTAGQRSTAGLEKYSTNS
ncbi:12674_t:CDS:2 [Funneliformis geosporum]|uniref:12674_t:CDS:1 n=1 Tax=Funneliformis geosporum TaxID=1117311 RepID=A0A9W4SLC6_9GLOM|nr:12674_t:CDS:2 [Funneliformis geosporum]